MVHPPIPRIKKKSIRLNPVLFKEPKIRGLTVEAKVPKTFINPFPIPTTLVGNSSTAYIRKVANSTAIQNLKMNIKIS